MSEYTFSAVKMEELDQAMVLYDSGRNREFCPWTEDYPTREDIQRDIGQGDLFCFRDEAGRLIACIAKDRDEVTAQLPFWSKEYEPAAELSRLVVADGYEGRGIARDLIRAMMEELKRRGYAGVHYLVVEANVPAMRSYRVLNFTKVGEADEFGSHFLCYEHKL